MLDSTFNSSLTKNTAKNRGRNGPSVVRVTTQLLTATAGQTAADVMQPKGQARQSRDHFTVILHSFTPFHLC